MPSSIYPSRIDAWIAAILLGAMLAYGYALVRLLSSNNMVVWIALSVFLIAALGLMASILLRTRYSLDDTTLRVRCGPFLWRIALQDIRRVTPTRSASSSPALSLQRLHIEYGRVGTIMISPRDQAAFLIDLEQRRQALGLASN